MSKTTRVLLVDDDESAFLVYSRRFQQAFGNSVVLDHCQDDGMLDDILSHVSYAVVVLDQMLQNGTTGLDLVPTIRRFGNGARILMNSGYGSEELAAKAIEAGVDGYVLGKKEDVERLVQGVREALTSHDQVERIRADVMTKRSSLLHQRCDRLRKMARERISP